MQRRPIPTEKKDFVILDTNILMSCRDEEQLFQTFQGVDIFVTIGTLRELDRLKMSDGQRGFSARNGLRIIRKNLSKRIEILHNENLFDEEGKPTETFGNSVDEKIILSGLEQGATVITNDLSMASISSSLGVTTKQYQEQENNVRDGVHFLDLSDKIRGGATPEQFLYLLDDEVRVNEYIAIKEYKKVTNIFRKEGPNNYEKVVRAHIPRTEFFGPVTPYNEDVYQACAIDSLMKNQINILTGPAGSGKTFLALAAQWHLYEIGEIEGITIFVNPVKTKNSKELGFYKGDQLDKLLQEGIGAILASKLGGGDKEFVRGLVQAGVLNILPISDIRGYEVTDNRSLFITEAQNLDVELMKLALQRAQSCKVFVEGDPGTQLDGWMYEGSNNGMKRAIEVFSGEDIFGTVALKNIYRSRIAEIAEKM